MHGDSRSISSSPRRNPSRFRVDRPIDVVLVGEAHALHHIRRKEYAERPLRVSAILKGLERIDVSWHASREYSLDPIREVHDGGMVDFLEKAARRLADGVHLYPEAFPLPSQRRSPKSWEFQLGFYCNDAFTPVTNRVFHIARQSVHCAMTGADLILEGSPLAYSLCRPPGHHTTRGIFGGYCYLNNTAIAAHYLSQKGKVAIVDLDYHHGNGTQDIFYHRGDVFFASIHGHPDFSYPYFAGYANERGEGEGRGRNRNFPLQSGIGDGEYQAALEKTCVAIRRFRPKYLVVSLGLDIMRGDQEGTFLVTAAGMREIGAMLHEIGVPTLVIQEGGYALNNLRRGAVAFLGGLGGAK
ncbi:MAG: histone deacetylase family protein [Candidatus Sumerlaeia bacterium]